MKKLMVIDGSSLLYRAFFALPPLQNALGVPTNAVYGFLTMLTKLYEEINPDYIAVAFDKGKETFRMDIYEDYKGTRQSAPDELRPQFSLIREVLESLGIIVIEEEGFEGDDIIGSLSKKWGSSDLAVHIITGDRDNLQLVDEYTSVFLTKKGITDMLHVTMTNMEELYGYGPQMVIEMKSLMGDSSDNIPGVSGVGEKTALKLLNQYGTLEGVYEHIEEQKGKLKERLVDNKDLAFISHQLATIKTDMDMPYELEQFVPVVHRGEVTPLFEKLGFHAVTPRLLKAMGVAEEGTLFDQFLAPPAEEIELTHVTEVPKEFYENKIISVVLKEAGTHPFRTIEALYLYNGDTQLVVNGFVDVAHVEAVFEGAKEVVTDNAKLLFEVLGTETTGRISILKEDSVHIKDLTLMAYLLDPTRANYGMTYLCERFGQPSIPATENETEWALQAQALYHMHEKATEEMEVAGVWDLYRDIELPLLRTLCVLEKNGIYMDVDQLHTTLERFKIEVTALQEKIYGLAGETFNINSPKQLGVILFEKLQLPVIKKTKTGYSTDAEVLDMLRNDHEIVAQILAYRSVVKLVSTYLEGFEGLINPHTNRIHTTFNQMVTATGRLSSSDPNLQNIPVRSEKGREIRALFKPNDGFDMFVSADYSQIELRILAHLSEDPALIQAFQNGEDIHRFTAAEVLGKSLEEVTPLERSHAKAINFGIIYGISDFGLSRDLGITRAEAKEYIELYFSRYPQIKAYMDRMVQEAHESGSVRTMFGRVRPLPDINSRNFNRRSFAERTAMNTPIQGTAADIIKLAMNQVEEALEEQNLQSRILLQVHDELVLEVVKDEQERVETLLRQCMEQVVSLRVPLQVDVHSATNWADVK